LVRVPEGPRERPIIGDRRTPSPLGDIQPDHWLAGYTTELIDRLNVLGWLVDLEPAQAALLDKVCAGPTRPRICALIRRFEPLSSRVAECRGPSGQDCLTQWSRETQSPADASVV
jgi:hypothetical protein